MITKELYPEISEESIQQALKTSADKEYPESVLQDKFGIETRTKQKKRFASILLVLFVLFAFFSLIYSFIRPGFLRIYTVRDRVAMGSLSLIGVGILLVLNRQPKQTPQPLDKVVRTFYINLPFTFPPLFTPSDSFQSYLILAPGEMEKMSLNDFEVYWENLEEDIVSSIRYQDTTTCSHCHKSSKGLWHVEKIWAQGDIPVEAKLFFECPGCNNIYCIECFNSFPNRHQCPQCGKKLKDENQGIAIFMQEPWLKTSGFKLDIQIDQQDDRRADVMCEMLFSFTCKRISAPATLYGVSVEEEFLKLGEKGEAVVRVRNKAVKIGENWRLMSAGIC